MKSLFDHYHIVNYNAFTSASLLVEFYEELKNVQQNLLLAQLVIPICNHLAVSSTIKNAMFGDKRRSTLWSIFNDYSKHYDLQDRIIELRYITNLSLQYAQENEFIDINPQSLAVEFKKKATSNNETLEKLRSARNLGKLFSNHSLIEIFNHLKISPL